MQESSRRVVDAEEEGSATIESEHAVASEKNLQRRRCLPAAWDLLTAWGRAELPRRAPPLSPTIMLAIAGELWLRRT